MVQNSIEYKKCFKMAGKYYADKYVTVEPAQEQRKAMNNVWNDKQYGLQKMIMFNLDGKKVMQGILIGQVKPHRYQDWDRILHQEGFFQNPKLAEAASIIKMHANVPFMMAYEYVVSNFTWRTYLGRHNEIVFENFLNTKEANWEQATMDLDSKGVDYILTKGDKKWLIQLKTSSILRNDARLGQARDKLIKISRELSRNEQYYTYITAIAVIYPSDDIKIQKVWSTK